MGFSRQEYWSPRGGKESDMTEKLTHKNKTEKGLDSMMVQCHSPDSSASEGKHPSLPLCFHGDGSWGQKSSESL